MTGAMNKGGFANITFQQLEALTGLVEAGSFTHAAGRMGLGQPMLAKQVHGLEKTIQMILASPVISVLSIHAIKPFQI